MDHSRTLPYAATPSCTQTRDSVACATIRRGRLSSLWTRRRKFFEVRVLTEGRCSDREKKSVAELLRDFAGKKCTIPRNQFYSVFDLCEERNDLTVDYSSNKSDLVHHVLQMSRKKVAYAR
jgi:hypothetical protein